MNFINEFKSSIKSYDTEEKLDLVFYRPLGFAIAKISNVLQMTPTMLSLLGLFSGIAAAYLFSQGSNNNFILAAILFLLSGIFDSSDGQLARISGKSTKLGLILDGICDSLVTISIYLAGLYLWYQEAQTPYIYIVGFFAALFHSNQCAVLDFYHREYLFFGVGNVANDTYWNPEIDEAKNNIKNSNTLYSRILNFLRLNWIKQQRNMSSRPKEWRTNMRKMVLGDSPQKIHFMKRYRELNKPLLPYWRLIGTNAHTAMIILAFYFNFFPLYLIFFDIILSNLVIFIVRKIQFKKDEILYKEFFHA